MENELKLSVLVVTYNHEKYIKEAINSILMQKTSHQYEIVVADDCSTDGTMKIIKEYQQKFPDKFRILEPEANLGITKNYKRGFKACNGEYVAILEGDDYWTSPYKLEKQISFLDKHRDCVLVFNRFLVFDMSTNKKNAQPWYSYKRYQKTTVNELIISNFIGNFSTCMYRLDAVKAIDESLYEHVVYDWMLNIVLATKGLIGYLPRVMSVYRLNPSGTWSQKSNLEKIKHTIESIDIYNNYLDYKYDNEFTQHRDRLSKNYENLTNSVDEYIKPTYREILRYYCPEFIISILKVILPKKFVKAISNQEKED